MVPASFTKGLSRLRLAQARQSSSAFLQPPTALARRGRRKSRSSLAWARSGARTPACRRRGLARYGLVGCRELSRACCTSGTASAATWASRRSPQLTLDSTHTQSRRAIFTARWLADDLARRRILSFVWVTFGVGMIVIAARWQTKPAATTTSGVRSSIGRVANSRDPAED